MELSREDWEKMFKEANMLIKEAMINLAVFRNTAKLAERNLRNFPEKLKLNDIEKKPTPPCGNETTAKEK